jgi:hypothetical protein
MQNYRRKKISIGSLTAKTYTWTPVEWNVVPRVYICVLLPSLRPEYISIGPPQILSSVHGMNAKRNHGAFRHENRGFPIRSTAKR